MKAITTTLRIERINKTVEMNTFSLWLRLFFSGRVSLGMFSDDGGHTIEYFAFKCPIHGIRTDMTHGYSDGCYYHDCDLCDFRYLFL